MTIAKGQPWGRPGTLPPDGVLARTDAEAAAFLRDARLAEAPPPVVGLLGGDLCKTLGGRGDEARLRSGDAVMFPIDAVAVTADGQPLWFVAHGVVRSLLWRRSIVLMNAAWLGSWNAAPRSHPNDGELDWFVTHLRIGDLAAVRRRIEQGAHLPHPRIEAARAPTARFGLLRPRRLRLDGVDVGRVTDLRIRVEPDALTVVV